ncbi:glucokinase [Halpernia frigidisoli]|uniref:Glucokinase n=1 Tax=Halpernia frigidisoli TaxID=1125876 RepID=A0A1I3ILM7_9FLAO|nr:glucokinase [Halpernia frigidisoli]SFI48789.1 glucokinase [Halpernia frigidisoli]
MSETAKFNLYLPGLKNPQNENLNIVSADIRAEKTSFNYFQVKDGNLINKGEDVYNTFDFSSFSEMVSQFINDQKLEKPNRLSVGVPGPVINEKCVAERLPWSLVASEIKSESGIEHVYLINDMEATAYFMGNLTSHCLSPIYEHGGISDGNVAILAPGNGLGEAGMFWDGKYLRPFATEGGHSEFSPRTDVEVEFYQYLKAIYGIVSWESVLSKDGLFNIYRFLRDVQRHKEPEWLTAKIQSEEDFVKVICEAATNEKEMICVLTMDTFIDFLAREANSLVLKLKATGGLIIGGEIPLTIKNYIDNDKFYKKFIISDKMESLLKDVNIYFLLNDKTIVSGAAYYGAFHVN